MELQPVFLNMRYYKSFHILRNYFITLGEDFCALVLLLLWVNIPRLRVLGALPDGLGSAERAIHKFSSTRPTG